MNHAEDSFEEPEYQYAIRPNKSEIKRESAALEDLGIELIGLPKERLVKLDLSPALLEALLLAQAIEKHHGAFKRQRKFIAKLLRDTDVAPIRAQLEQHAQVTAHVTRQVHVIERWRDRLLKGDDNDLNALMAEHPDADRQKLRQLIRDARKEHLAAQPPRSARLLFKYLRELMLVEEAGDEADEDYQEELP